MDPLTIGLMVAVVVSEGLALIPQVKANSIFQLVYNGLRVVTRRGGGARG